MQNLLYFIHIPKTAGTTMRSSLQNHFLPNEVIDSWNREDVFSLPFSKLDAAKLIMSHSGRIFADGFEKPIDYAVVLRDPIDLVMSQFRQMKTDDGHPDNKKMKDIDSASFFAEEVFRRSYSNYMTRHVLAKTASDFHMLSDGADYLTLSERESLLESGLDSAVDFLLGAAFVATIEDINQLYLNVCADRGWVPQDLPILNQGVAPPALEIKPELIEIISFANRYDVELYRRVVEGLQNMREPFRAALRRALRGHLTRSTMIDLWSDYFQRGWYPAERNNSGQDRRWSGPEARSSVFLPIGARNFSLKIVFAAILESSIDGMRLLLEGHPVAARIIKNPTLEFNEFMLTADISVTARRNQSFAELEIEVPKRVCPKTDMNQEDTRNLGIYLKEFTVLLR